MCVRACVCMCVHVRSCACACATRVQVTADNNWHIEGKVREAVVGEKLNRGRSRRVFGVSAKKPKQSKTEQTQPEPNRKTEQKKRTEPNRTKPKGVITSQAMHAAVGVYLVPGTKLRLRL